MANRWKRKSLDDLVEEYDAGMRGQGAFAEIHRRTARNTTWLMIIGIVLTVLVLILAAATVFPRFAEMLRELVS
jgi:hypothetical protein